MRNDGHLSAQRLHWKSTINANLFVLRLNMTCLAWDSLMVEMMCGKEFEKCSDRRLASLVVTCEHDGVECLVRSPFPRVVGKFWMCPRDCQSSAARFSNMWQYTDKFFLIVSEGKLKAE